MTNKDFMENLFLEQLFSQLHPLYFWQQYTLHLCYINALELRLHELLEQEKLKIYKDKLYE